MFPPAGSHGSTCISGSWLVQPQGSQPSSVHEPPQPCLPSCHPTALPILTCTSTQKPLHKTSTTPPQDPQPPPSPQLILHPSIHSSTHNGPIPPNHHHRHRRHPPRSPLPTLSQRPPLHQPRPRPHHPAPRRLPALQLPPHPSRSARGVRGHVARRRGAPPLRCVHE